MFQSTLPDIEAVSDQVHQAWMDGKRAAGVTSRKSEAGEELMVPYADLSEAAKELDRATVRAVYAAIERAQPASYVTSDGSPCPASVALEAARYELVTLHGLIAADGAAPLETFPIDTEAAVARIDAALSASGCTCNPLS